MLEDLNALLVAAKELPDTPADGEYQKLPDGEYDAVIDNVKFAESKKGNIMFVWEFIITDGPFIKYHEWKYSVLNSPENMKRLTTDLNKFGIDTEKGIEKIEKQFNNLVDVPVILIIESKVSKNDPDTVYRNISVKPCNL